MQKFCKALKRSFIVQTSCRPPTHLTAPHPHLGAPTFEDFAWLHFPQVFARFHVSKIKLNPIEGVMSAVLRQPSGVIPRTLYLMVLAFSLKKSKCGKNLGKHTEFQNPYRRRDAGVPPGSFRVLFFRILKFGKHTFSKKGPKLKKT